MLYRSSDIQELFEEKASHSQSAFHADRLGGFPDSHVIPRILRSNYGSYRFSGLAIMGVNPSEEQARQTLRPLWEQYPQLETIPIVATGDTLEQYLTNNWVDEVYLDVPPKADLPVDLINNLMRMGITIYTALTNLDELESRHKNVEWICGHLTITTSLGYITGRDVFLKRVMDLAGGLIGSLFTVILLPPSRWPSGCPTRALSFLSRPESVKTEKNSRCTSFAACI